MVRTDDVIAALSRYNIELGNTEIDEIVWSVEEYIKNFCNIREIPPELYYTAVDMCCGKIMKDKVAIGELDIIEPSGEVASITEGDVSISYRSGTGSSTVLKGVIDKLCSKDKDLIPFRKMRW